MPFRTYAAIVLFVAGVATAEEELFPNWPELDAFRRSWYSKHLNAMGEQALGALGEGERVRLLLLPTFGHPRAVRIECRDECSLVAHQLSGFGGYEPGVIQRQTSRQLNADEAQELRSKLHAANLWNDQPATDAGRDGTQLVVEAQGSSGYAAWDVWTPSRNPDYAAFVELCTLMLRLAALDSEPVRSNQ